MEYKKEESLKMEWSEIEEEEQTITKSRDKNHSLIPWIEKYRPQTMNDIYHQDHITNILKASMDTGNLPHLLFYGHPGTGKTSTILALSKTLFGTELFRHRVLELNASDERGIKVIREKIKTFAQQSIKVSTDKDKKYPTFKIIILDEADMLTTDAQSALRRIIEKYSKVTRFCLICNYITRIIEPLASRCAKFRFQSLSNESIYRRLDEISQKENFELKKDIIDLVITVSEGDMRKAVNYLQFLYILSKTDSSINSYQYDILGIIPEEIMNNIWYHIIYGTFDDIYQYMIKILNKGYSVSKIIQTILNQIMLNKVKDLEVKEEDKASLCIKIAEIENGLQDSILEEVHLLHVLCLLYKTLHV